MRLTQKNLPVYLLDKGFLEYDSFMKGDFQAVQLQNRNSIFKVHQNNALGLFVKQLNNMDQMNSYLLQKEATCYYLIHNEALYKHTQAHVPAYFGYDAASQVLVTEYMAPSKNIIELHHGQKAMPLARAKTIAQVLAGYHFDVRDQIAKLSSLQFFSRQIPWAIQMGYNNGLQWSAGTPQNTSDQIAQIIRQNPEYARLMQQLAKDWQATSLIHGDIKWVNFIVTEPDTPQEKIQLIDWEIADIGDPLWDVAGAFQSFLVDWIFAADYPTAYQLMMQGLQPDSIAIDKPALQAFWKAYGEARKFSIDEDWNALLKTIRFTGARLVQMAVESNQFQEALQPNAGRLLQLSLALLSTPERFAEELLGITTNALV